MKNLLKKTLLLALAAMLLALPALAEETVDPLTKIEAESGIVEAVEGGVRLAGRTEDNSGDAYLNTWHILQESVADFDWNFKFTPTLVGWNMDKVMFRSVDENEWNGYALKINGSELGLPTLQLLKGEAYNDEPYGTADMTLEAGVTYAVRILAEGKSVKVWFTPAEELTEETEPVIDVELPDDPAEYRTTYIESGDFQFISWAGDFVVSEMSIEVK